MKHGQLTPALAKKIQVLRDRIEKSKIPPSKLDETINLACWNIREFGKKARTKDAIHLIAEVLSQFDLIAMVELRDKLEDMAKVMDILGPYWRLVYSDYRVDAAGNHERVGFLYDNRAVVFTGLAAEVDQPRKKDPKTGLYYALYEEWWRSPYMASFRAGNFDFVLIGHHEKWGTGAKDRVKPLAELAAWVDWKRNEPGVEDKDIILMGDFNIPNLADPTFKAITGKGLRMPQAFFKLKGSNLSKDSTYDQILHYPTDQKRFTDQGGVLDFYQGDHKPLFPDLDLFAFTFQMSDHLPMWIQIDTWIEGAQLDAALKQG